MAGLASGPCLRVWSFDKLRMTEAEACVAVRIGFLAGLFYCPTAWTGAE